MQLRLNRFVATMLLLALTVYARPSRRLYEQYLTKQSRDEGKKSSVDPGEPLFLTPLLQAGKTKEAIEQSRVNIVPGIESYSGYITIDSQTGANMFFWSFYANPAEQPVVIWLQGGPGSSSLYGLFVLNGPLFVGEDNQAYERTEYSWADKYNMLYIDNPVGTGFSFVTDDAGYRTNEDGVADHLYKFLLQYYQLFPHLKSNPLFISGESYAGKYIPALAAKVAMMEKTFDDSGTENPVAKLGGILVGNGLTDPESMITMGGDLLHSLGFLDDSQRKYYNKEFDRAAQFIRQGRFMDAFDIDDYMKAG